LDKDELMHRFPGGYAAVADAVEGLTDVELDHVPLDGGWTARQVVHHLADSEARAYVRLRRLVAEDEPEIIGYDEPEYARRLYYDRPIAASLAVLAAVRESSWELLERLTPAEWERRGTHSESGTYGVGDWLRIYASHPYDHAAQIRQAVGSA
jgi:hypothetical protein